MKRVLGTALLSCMALAIVGCHASADVDPPRGSSSDSSMSTKKVTVRDANGNVVEQKTERHVNP